MKAKSLREEIRDMVDYWNEDPSLMRNEGVEAICRKIRQRVEWLLKEIKEAQLIGVSKRDYPTDYDKGYNNALSIVQDLIKKKSF